MGYDLRYQPLTNVGINGLNTQDNPTSLDSSWLTDANNIVLREGGQISFRKGFKQKVLSSTIAKVGSLTEYNNSGTYEIFAAVDDDIYEIDFTAPDTPWTLAFATGGTASDWQFVHFNKFLYAFQAGHHPLYYDGTTWDHLRDQVSYAAPAGITDFQPSCAMGYYGRLWAAGQANNESVVYYSDTLIDHKWGGSGASGYLDLNTVWGSDEVVALAPFYGKLVIFGKQNIAIYANPEDPNTMTLDEVIEGIGLVSRDTVQAIGDDLVFLSSTGLRSLARTTEKDNIPLQDLSVNVKDTLVRNVGQKGGVKSTYVEDEGIYLLAFTSLNLTYVFDMKHITPNDAPRITTWTCVGDATISNVCNTETYGLLIGQADGGIAEYSGYYDQEYVSGGIYNKNPYTGNFKTTWIDMGEGAMSALLKNLKAVVSGGQGTTVGVKWYVDFSTTPKRNMSFTLNPTSSGIAYLYEAASSLFGTAKFAPTYGLKEYSIPLVGSAKYLQFELSAETRGYVASLQDMTLLYKQGKIR